MEQGLEFRIHFPEFSILFPLFNRPKKKIHENRFLFTFTTEKKFAVSKDKIGILKTNAFN